MDLIYKQLNGVLDALGVKPVLAEGNIFDPHLHEAVVTEPTDDYEPDTVMQEIVRGFRVGDRVDSSGACKSSGQEVKASNGTQHLKEKNGKSDRHETWERRIAVSLFWKAERFRLSQTKKVDGRRRAWLVSLTRANAWSDR